ncbi:hypothetical protein L596_004127 [Steinernema carpocapsae]|uniref:Uncharacterized protein n=1 Tax=Steinernema carpocapsae TaxID=34508 RepID=A0A4U8UYA9_STECR|nr:hypothetical protein L596_004127 [Steinernema carpocapsae]
MGAQGKRFLKPVNTTPSAKTIKAFFLITASLSHLADYIKLHLRLLNYSTESFANPPLYALNEVFDNTGITSPAKQQIKESCYSLSKWNQFLRRWQVFRLLAR